MPRGGKRDGAGRPKGSPNKATADARAVFQALFEEQAPKAAGWFAEVASENPAKALECLLRLAEYHVPKLAQLKVDLGAMPVEDILAELERRAANRPGPGEGAGPGPDAGA